MLGLEIREQVTNYVGKRIEAMRQGAEGAPSHHNVSAPWRHSGNDTKRSTAHLQGRLMVDFLRRGWWKWWPGGLFPVENPPKGGTKTTGNDSAVLNRAAC